MSPVWLLQESVGDDEYVDYVPHQTPGAEFWQGLISDFELEPPAGKREARAEAPAEEAATPAVTPAATEAATEAATPAAKVEINAEEEAINPTGAPWKFVRQEWGLFIFCKLKFFHVEILKLLILKLFLFETFQFETV